MSGDRGAAAIEMALVVTVLTGLLALVAPLSVLFYERVQLGQAAGELVRFASSRSDVARQAGSVTVERGLLPDQDALDAEALRFSLDEPITLTRTSDTDCPSGWRRQVALTTTVDLGPAGAAFAGLTGADTIKTLTASATSCEE